MAAPRYRPDLDGLRGVAILLVVAFHVWFHRVSGGVDVFLVLSGFFFTGMVLRQAETPGGVRVAGTGWRTVRRLAPVTTVVLAALLCYYALRRPYTQWGDVATQVVASALYYQNWHLARAGTNYLAADPSVSPLQHLWSLSIQAQFYLAVLAAVAAVAGLCGLAGRPHRTRAAVGVVVAVAAVVSFGYATLAPHAQAWRYYDTGARAWEPLAGACLAVVAPSVRLPRRLRGWSAAAGLLMVCSCGVLWDGAALFPGPAALYPVGAAALLIGSGFGSGPDESTAVSRILSARPARLLGAVSYPLYVWHWPILICWLAHQNETNPGLRGGALVVGSALVLAYGTHRAVEQPLRRSTGPRLLRRGVGGAVAVLTAAVLLLAVGWQVVLRANPAVPPSALDPVRYPGAAVLTAGAQAPRARMRPTVFEGPVDFPPPTAQGCISGSAAVLTCAYGDPHAARTIAVVGSSHTESWIPALIALAGAHHFRLVAYLKMGCPLTLTDHPGYSSFLQAGGPECHSWSDRVIDLLGRTHPDWVFTIGTRANDGAGDTTPPEFAAAWSALTGRGLRVIALRDIPWLRRGGLHYMGVDCLANRGQSPQSCGMPRAAALSPVNPAAVAARPFAQVTTIDLSDALCRRAVCSVVEGNVLIYRDDQHLTASYARTLAPELGARLAAITHWW